MPLHVQRVQSLNYSSPAAAAVNTSNTLEVAANDARKYLLLVNASAYVMYLGIGTAAETGKGIYLASAGGSFEMVTSNLSNEAIYAICAGGGGSEVLTVQEAT